MGRLGRQIGSHLPAARRNDGSESKVVEGNGKVKDAGGSIPQLRLTLLHLIITYAVRASCFVTGDDLNAPLVRKSDTYNAAEHRSTRRAGNSNRKDAVFPCKAGTSWEKVMSSWSDHAACLG